MTKEEAIKKGVDICAIPDNPRFINLTTVELPENSILTVISLFGKRPKKDGYSYFWLCECSCGLQTIVDGRTILRGQVKSCGCLNRDKSCLVTHGKSKTSEYSSLKHIKDRCYNEDNEQYKDYGGRGIKVCDSWLESSTNFLNDMGLKPGPEYSIDRIDNDGDYSPENCRWSTKAEQNRNCSRNIFIEYDGEKRIINDWAKITGISYRTISYREKRGWSPEKILTIKPTRKRKKIQ